MWVPESEVWYMYIYMMYFSSSLAKVAKWKAERGVGGVHGSTNKGTGILGLQYPATNI